MNTLNTAELGRSLIACVDSDYDFLLQGATNTSVKSTGAGIFFRLIPMLLKTIIVLPKAFTKYVCRLR